MPPHLYPLPQNGGEDKGEGDVEENTGFYYFCEAQ